MITRPRLMERIRTNLAFFVLEMQSALKNNRIDSSAVLEDFSLGLLNLVYGYELVNTNKIQHNFPAVDLIDEKHRIAVQVTANYSRAKIRHTIDSFLDNQLHLRFGTLLVLILGSEAVRSQDIAVSDFNLQVMTLKDLIIAIEALDLGRLKGVDTYLQERIGAANADTSASNMSSSASIEEIDGLTEAAKEVLLYASLLSDEGLERTVFEQGLINRSQYKLLHDLTDQNFFYENNSVLYIQPAIRQDCRRRLKESKTNCTVFLDRLWDYEQSDHWDRISLRSKLCALKCLALLYENAFDVLSDPDAVYLRRSAELWQKLREFEHALTAERRALEALESGKRSPWSIARAYHFTGNCSWEQAENYRSTGEKQEASQKYQLALADWETVLNMCRDQLTASDPDIAAALQDVGQAQLALERFFPARDTLLRALKLREQLHSSELDFPKLKKLYGKLDEVYRGLRNFKSAELCRRNADYPDEPIWEFLNNELVKAKTYRFSLPPRTALTADHFVGREEELRKIEQLLLAHEKPIIISGLGGTGKTELAVHFAQRYTEGSVYFVRFQDSFTYTLASMYSYITPSPPIESAWLPLTEQYQFVLSVLANCSESDLLIIDDVGNKSRDLQILIHDPSFIDLRNLPIRLILTTRSPAPGHLGISLSPLPREDLYQIFESHEAELDHSQMDALIDFVNGHTLSIDLIAQTLAGPWSTITPEELLDALRSNTLEDLEFPEVESSYNLSQRTILRHLQSMINIASISEDEKRALCCAVLFPDSGMDTRLVGRTLPENQRQTLRTLIKQGWIIYEHHRFSIHPVIRVVCRTEFKPSDEICGDFLDSLWNNYDAKTFDRVIFTQMAEVFARAADLLEDWEAKWINRAGHLWNELTESQRTLELYTKHLPTLEDRLHDTPALAEAYTNLGIAYGHLGDHQREMEYQIKALKIREADPSADPLSLSASYNNIGTAYSTLGEYSEALEYGLKSLAILKSTMPPDHPALADIYSNIGMVYGKQGDYQSAEEYQKCALDIRRRILSEDHPDLAYSYDQIGVTYSQLGRYEEGLECLLKALASRELVLGFDHPDLAKSYSNVGHAYSDLGDHQKALEYSLKSLSICEKVLAPEHPGLTSCYDSAGIAYANLGDLQQALTYLLKSLAIKKTTLPKNHPDLVISHSRIGSIYFELEVYDQALTHQLEAHSINLRILPPDAPALAESYNELGMTYFRLGDYIYALGHLENALAILQKTLSDEHPKIQSIKATIKRIEESLK